MSPSVVHHDDQPTTARRTRERLFQAGVFTINLIGPTGCGKTTLIGQTLRRLVLTTRIGVVACDPATHRDADRMAAIATQAVQVDTGEGRLLEAEHIEEAIGRLDLERLDLILIENVSSVIGPAELDIGEDIKVGMFSVAEGDDKADKYADVARQCGLVILNKLDLISLVPFDLAVFRGDVARLNPVSPLMEMSALTGEGLEPWLQWLKRHVRKPLAWPARRS